MTQRLLEVLIRGIILVTVIPIHECAHALVASWLGDDTARLMGRCTLNPLAHLDPIGSLLLLLTGFGWAKPVPIYGRGFRRFKRDMALTALAGPAANLLLAVAVAVVFKVVNRLAPVGPWGMVVLLILLWNTLALAVFNMIPIPPLDGSRLVTALLPDRLYLSVMRYERIILGVLMAGLFLGIFSFPISSATQFLYDLVDNATWFLGRLPRLA